MYIDLSQSVNQMTPVYPGDPEITITPAGKLEQDGFNDHALGLNTHVGTHIDAPLHMIAEGKSLGEYSLDTFVGKGRVVQVQGNDFDTVRSANVQAGDIVLFQTGMSDHYHEARYFEDYPAMSEDVANYLVESKVKLVGVDTCSVDNQDEFPIHKILLGGDVLIIENLTNLDKLQGNEFKVYALPLKLEIDGAPARVIAETL